MASNALEEKINKIRQQNEEIKRRYEEVEADKKNAAKSNALVQLVPSDDWPERREPPEFTGPPKNLQKQKSVTKDRENERPTQHYSGIQERLAKKDHKFAEGEGPPPDPKYNFLADSERETRTGENKTDEDKNKSRNRAPRGGAGPRRRGGGNNMGGGGSRDAFFKDNRGPHTFHSREESLPEYEAWRAERNRIDEARINRQKTAEGNWRREWDCNKVSLEKDQPRRDFPRKDSNTYDRRNNHYDNDYSNRGHGGSRTYHQSQKNFSQDYRHPHHEQPHEFKRQQSDCKTPLSPVDNRSVAAFDQSIKVTVNQGSQANKATVMSVKVNSPSIAGTGRVGPRQKSRITYSSQSDSNPMTPESNSFMRQKSFDEKTAAANFSNGPKLAPKSPFAQRKKEGNPKSPHFSKKEFKSDDFARLKNQPKASHSQRNESRDQRQSNNFLSKPQRIQKRKPESNKTGNVSVVEDSVLVENDIDKPIDTEFHTQNEENDDFKTNDSGEKISDESGHLDDAVDNTSENVSLDIDETLYDSNIGNDESVNYENDSVVADNDAVDNTSENVSLDIDEILYDSNDESVNYKTTDDVIKDQVGDAVEESHENTEIEPICESIQNNAIPVHEEIIETDKETSVVADFKPAMEDPTEEKVEISENLYPLGEETKEVAQKLDDTTIVSDSNVVETCAAEVKVDVNENTQPLHEETERVVEKQDKTIEVAQTLDEPTIVADSNLVVIDAVEKKVDVSENMQPLDNETKEVAQKQDQAKEVVHNLNETTLEPSANPTFTEAVEELTAAVKIEANEISQLPDCETKEITLDDAKKVDIDLEVEQKESITEEQSEKTTCKENETAKVNSVESKVDESKVEDNSINDSIEPEDNAQANDSLQTIENDSGFLDNGESDSFNKTNTTESNDSDILNVSSAVEDLNDSQKSGAENNEISPEATKSDLVSVTKGDDKAVDICDNVGDTQIEDRKPDTKEISENSIKDNDAKIIEIAHQSSELPKAISSQEENVNIPEKKVEQVTEESTEIVFQE